MQKTFCTPNGFSKFVSVIFSNYCVLTIDIFKHIEATAFLLITKTFRTDQLTYINTYYLL